VKAPLFSVFCSWLFARFREIEGACLQGRKGLPLKPY